MSEFQNTIDLLGDDVTSRMIVDRTITEFSDDLLTVVGNYAFYSCSKLTSVNMPNVTSIGSYALQDCSTLTSVNMPNVTSIGNSAFQNCSTLASVDIPKVTSIGQYTFYRCSTLASVDLPKVTSIGQYTFYRCSTLTRVILRSKTLCAVGNTNAFNYTPFASGGTGGTVYVPSALISQYQTATNWSTLYAAGTCNFVAIEGSEYE